MAGKRVFKECSEKIMGYGNLTQDPKEIADGVLAVNVAANYTKVRKDRDGEFYGEEGTNFRKIIVRRPHSEAVKDFKKGDPVVYFAEVYGSEWEDKDGNNRHSEELTAEMFGRDVRFDGYGKGKSNRSSSSSSSSGREKSRSDDIDDDDLDIDIDI